MPDPTKPLLRRDLSTVLVVAVAIALVGFGIAAFWPWISDDAFIVFRYAQRLIDGKGLTWDDFDRVEGYSNLLWILSCAGLRGIGLDMVTAARALGIAATIATFVTLARSPLLREHGLLPGATVWIVAAIAPVSLWAIGGLEGPLTMFLVTFVFLRVGEALRDPSGPGALRACRGAGLALFWLALCRSEGPLWGGFAALAVLLFGRPGPDAGSGALRRRLTRLVLPMAIAVLAQLAFRLWYYGEWVPNTAHAKLASSPETLAVGLRYLGSAAAILRSLWIPAAGGFALALFDRRVRGLTLVVGAALLTWTAYVGSIGGDWYPLCRYLQGTYGLLALLAGLGLGSLSRFPAGRWIGWAILIAAVATARWDARLDPSDTYQKVSTWEWRGRAVGEWLGRAFGHERPLLALDPAGAVPFYSGLPCVDMLGLCDRTIAKTPPPRPEHVIPAHSRGNPGYVLDRRPDLLLFGTPVGDLVPRHPGGWQMEAEEPRFLRDYRCVMIRTGPVPVTGEGDVDLKITLRVRVAGRIGVRREGEEWIVPGWLLTGHRQEVPIYKYEPDRRPEDPQEMRRLLETALALKNWWDEEAAVAVFDSASGEVVAEVRKPGRFALKDLALPGGSYRLHAPEHGAVAFELVGRGGTACRRRDGVYELPSGGRVDVVVTVAKSAALPLRLGDLRLLRTRLAGAGSGR